MESPHLEEVLLAFCTLQQMNQLQIWHNNFELNILAEYEIYQKQIKFKAYFSRSSRGK